MWASLCKYGRIPSAGLNFSNVKVPNAGGCFENAGQWSGWVPEASNRQRSFSTQSGDDGSFSRVPSHKHSSKTSVSRLQNLHIAISQ